jgi:hypothetical protein
MEFIQRLRSARIAFCGESGTGPVSPIWSTDGAVAAAAYSRALDLMSTYSTGVIQMLTSRTAAGTLCCAH